MVVYSVINGPGPIFAESFSNTEEILNRQFSLFHLATIIFNYNLIALNLIRETGNL